MQNYNQDNTEPKVSSRERNASRIKCEDMEDEGAGSENSDTEIQDMPDGLPAESLVKCELADDSDEPETSSPDVTARPGSFGFHPNLDGDTTYWSRLSQVETPNLHPESGAGINKGTWGHSSTREVPAFSCSGCGYTFGNALYFQTHPCRGERNLASLRLPDTEILAVGKADETHAQPKPRDAAKPFHCSVCEKGFERKPDMIRHMKAHSGDKPYQCNLCLKRFSRIDHFKSHLRTHSCEKPFQCNFCEMKFKRMDFFTSHVKMHTGEKVFTCEACGKKFDRSNNLTEHIRTHTGEKPFQCHVCERRFTRMQHLKSHVRSHTGERPFQCDLCQKTFTRMQYLTEHYKTHTGENLFRCNVCHKTYTRNQHLNEHMKIHTGSKPFQCSACKKMFTRLKHLTTHMKSHAVMEETAGGK